MGQDPLDRRLGAAGVFDLNVNRVEGKAALITGGGAGIGAVTGELICTKEGLNAGTRR